MKIREQDDKEQKKDLDEFHSTNTNLFLEVQLDDEFLEALNSDIPGEGGSGANKKIYEILRYNMVGAALKATENSQKRRWNQNDGILDEELQQPRYMKAYAENPDLQYMARRTGNMNMFEPPDHRKPTLGSFLMPQNLRAPVDEATRLLENPVGGVILSPEFLHNADPEHLLKYCNVQSLRDLRNPALKSIYDLWIQREMEVIDKLEEYRNVGDQNDRMCPVTNFFEPGEISYISGREYESLKKIMARADAKEKAKEEAKIIKPQDEDKMIEAVHQYVASSQNPGADLDKILNPEGDDSIELIEPKDLKMPGDFDIGHVPQLII